MASAPVKRKHYEGKVTERTHKKKKQESFARQESSGHRSRSKSKKKKRAKSGSGDERRGSLRVRSVSELASMVESGAIRVPKNLEHYIEDRTQLLDQVFTILSPDDIKGMLPDILKELRMKQVKQLCLDQLQHMTCEEIQTAIRAKDSCKEAQLDSTLMELLDQVKDTASSTHSPSSVAENRVDEHSASGGENISAETCGSPSPESKYQDESEDEIVIHVSDVSDEESLMVTDSKEDKSELCVGENKHSPRQEECADYAPSEGEYGEVSPHRDSLTAAAEDSSHYSGSMGSECSSDDGEGQNWSSSVSSDVTLLLEMELRKRALESMTKKPPHQETLNDYNVDGQATVQDTIIEARHSESDGADTAMQASAPQPISVHVNPIVESAVVDPGAMIEADLRQKALQSMLAKRKLRQNM